MHVDFIYSCINFIHLCTQLKLGNESSLGIEKGVHHLRKAVHMFPNSSVLR